MRRARLAGTRLVDVWRPAGVRAHAAVLLVSTLVALTGCASHRLKEQQQRDDTARLARARDLVHEGYYDALKQALALVQEVHDRARDKRQTADQLAQTALLVAAREKELAIADTGALAVAERALADTGDAAALGAALTIVRLAPLRHRGLAGFDTQGLRDDSQAYRDRFEAMQAATALIDGRTGEEFFASLLGSRPSKPVEETGQAVAGAAPPPQMSPLLLYRHAADSRDGRQLERLLERQPAFAEAHYAIGAQILDSAPRANDLARAQQHLVAALAALPGSAAVRMAAADLWFAVGDWDAAIESYDRTLLLAPTHRQALLRKAICMSLLPQPHQALAGLEHLEALPGGYLPGETHYWIAWNLRQLDRLSETQLHIARARVTLSGDSRVHLLAGQIAYALHDLEQAAADFRRATELNERECEAHAGKGAVQSSRREWPSASASYERAAVCQGARIAEADESIQELRAAALAENVRSRVIARRLGERDSLALARATNQLNAASAAFNAGDLRRTIELGDEASRHPLVAERARTLLEKVTPGLR